jgi:hypothetical protein
MMTMAPTPAPTATAEPVTPFRLTAVDRCDACGAQAYVAATVAGTELLYCAHHARKYETKLRASATSWHDESVRLIEEQSRAGGKHH